MIHKKQSILFILLVLGLSALLWGSLAVFQFQVPNLESGSNDTAIIPMIAYILNGFIPTILGLIFYVKTKDNYRQRLKTIIPKKKHIQHYGIITTVMIFIFFIQTLLYSLFIKSFDYSILLPQAFQLLPLIFLGPLSEEIGWRGYLNDELKAVYTPLKTALIIGVVWALWHLPLFYILGTTQHTNNMNFITFSVLVISVSIIMEYSRIKTDHSLFSGIYIHYLYTVLLTFFILGTTYSLFGDILSILPFVFISLYYGYHLKTHKTIEN